MCIFRRCFIWPWRCWPSPSWRLAAANPCATKFTDPTCSCPNGCYADGSCKANCTGDPDCKDGQQCLDGVCTTPDGDLDDNGGEGGEKDDIDNPAQEGDRDGADPWLKVDPNALNFGAVTQLDAVTKEVTAKQSRRRNA